jgi:hypothetical protein
LERLEITEDGSALVTVPITISLVEFDEVLLLSTWRSQSTLSTTMRRSLSLVRCRCICNMTVSLRLDVCWRVAGDVNDGYPPAGVKS